MPMILASSTCLPPSLSPSFFLQNFKVAAILLDLGAFQLVLLSSRVYFDHLANLLFQFLELSRNRERLCLRLGLGSKSGPNLL
jgi:hypothetical protein